NITIAKTGATTFTVTDPAGNVTGTGPDCTPAGPSATVTCQNITRDILVVGRDGNDTVALTPGTDVVADLQGNAGNDVLTGAGAMDALEGGNGDDTLNGGAGNDLMLPGYGSDHTNGGRGNDRIEQQSQAGDADVFNGDADDDAI